MQFDAPEAEPGLTRRARRTDTAAPAADSASSEAHTRSALRRTSSASAAAAPAVWSGTRRASAPAQTVVASVVESAAVAPVEVASVEVVPVEVVPVTTRRLNRIATTPIESVVVAAPIVEPVVAEPVVSQSVVAEPVVSESVIAQTAEPIAPAEVPARRRRVARPVVEAEPPVVVEPVVLEAVIAEPVVMEPVVVEPVVAEVPVIDAIIEPDVDPFDAAARLFSFTGENAIIRDEPVAEASIVADAEPVVLSLDDVAGASKTKARKTKARTAPRRTRSSSNLRSLATMSFSVGVMGAVGLLTVAVAAPAEAVAAAVQTEPVTSIQAPAELGTEVPADEIQAFVVPEGVDTDLGRDETYSTATFSEIAAATGITHHTNFFVNDPSATIQWPFAVGVPISDGYGPRWGSFHWGLDFTPGEGAEIQAVADGTVRVANESGGAFGVHVIIDHEINGEVFSTHYAHMQYGSLQVEAGQKVTVGTVLGHTGNTGLSYGAHLHFEVFIGGQRVDPLPWLRSHTGS